MKFPERNKQIVKAATALIAIAAFTSSCSKDNNSPIPGVPTKSGKFTISVKDLYLTESDNVSITFSGSDGTLNGTCWKVNGVARQNEPAINIDENDLQSGGDIVIETAKPLVSSSVSISIVNFGTPLKFNYTPSYEGSTQAPISETITDTYVKSFTY